MPAPMFSLRFRPLHSAAIVELPGHSDQRLLYEIHLKNIFDAPVVQLLGAIAWDDPGRDIGIEHD